MSKYSHHVEAHSPAFVLAALACLQPASAAESPFAGTWTANLSKSRLHPTMQYQSVQLDITTAADTVTLATELVDASGRRHRAAETFRTDGTETPGTLSAGVAPAARYVGTQVLATVATKSGQVIAVVTYEVSPDRTTLTSRSSGVIEQVLVFDRK